MNKLEYDFHFKDSNLYVLNKNNVWVKTSDLPNNSRYTEMYRVILNLLKSTEGKGSKIDNTYKNHHIYVGESMSVQIKSNESHRMCSILTCTQYDQFTNGLRFLAYGTKYNLDCDYGIGTCLESIDTTYTNKWCPATINTRYI